MTSFIKTLFVATIFTILCVANTPVSFAQDETAEQATAGFMEGLEDFPLMEGLIQLKDETLAFDSEKGRIVELYADSQSSNKTQIIKFYKETLPQLGWKQKDKDGLSFEREGESLNIEFSSPKPPLVVKFSVQD